MLLQFTEGEKYNLKKHVLSNVQGQTVFILKRRTFPEGPHHTPFLGAALALPPSRSHSAMWCVRHKPDLRQTPLRR